ncbi:MAG TPA: type II secretion system protein GspL [Usitatibacter sp.]|nr:type II secretion system protein GspL [Usitatibacter sp.]
MKLRIFLPGADAPARDAAMAWMLFDGRGQFLREGASPLAQMPRADEVEAMLPAERVLFARLKLPRVNAATIRELLPYAVEDRLLADPSHIHAVAGATNARGETVVCVVDREWLRAMLALLAGAGLKPARAFSESALLAGGRRDWHLVLGPARGMLVDDDGVSATFDRGPGVPLALRIALDEAAARGDRPQSLRVHTEGDEPLPDLEAWAREAGVALEAGTRWEIVARGQPAARSIDLLQDEFSPRGRRMPSIPRAAVALALAIATLQLAFMALDYTRLRAERQALEERREAIFREAFPQATVVVDPELQMTRNLAELKRSRGLASGDAFLAELTRIARAQGRVRAIEYGNGRMVAR